mmetsp:Transcript_60173/g.196581  ORF Transcript_60173/g.196581 Transcript_60173/m.196581 type:complete len:156 (-) Transcript_60173:146-613(-)
MSREVLLQWAAARRPMRPTMLPAVRVPLRNLSRGVCAWPAASWMARIKLVNGLQIRESNRIQHRTSRRYGGARVCSCWLLFVPKAPWGQTSSLLPSLTPHSPKTQVFADPHSDSGAVGGNSNLHLPPAPNSRQTNYQHASTMPPAPRRISNHGAW